MRRIRPAAPLNCVCKIILRLRQVQGERGQEGTNNFGGLVFAEFWGLCNRTWKRYAESPCILCSTTSFAMNELDKDMSMYFLVSAASKGETVMDILNAWPARFFSLRQLRALCAAESAMSMAVARFRVRALCIYINIQN